MIEPKKEPTTTELFATAREGLAEDSLGHAAESALSELERRMGAMTLAVEAAQRGEMVNASRLAALTDAPPVFTLEEVEAAFRATSASAVPETDWNALSSRLAALRQKD